MMNSLMNMRRILCIGIISGIGIDNTKTGERGVTLVRNTGKVALLQQAIDAKAAELNFDQEHEVHVGISHTRW